MKTENTNRKSPLPGFAKTLVMIILITFGLKAKAQCTADFTYVVDSTNNGMVYFNNTSSGGSGSFFTWYFGDGSVDYSSNPAPHTYTFTGNDTVTLVMSGDTLSLGGSCSDTVSYYFHVINNTPPSCNAYFSTIDSIGQVIFMDQSYGSPTAGTLVEHWDFGNGDSSNTAGSFIYNSYTPGTYYACLTVTNTAGTCAASTYCDSITVSSCYASFVSTPDASGYGMTFTSYISGSIDTYYWDFGDGYTSAAANPHHVYTAPGYYLVSLHASSTTDPACGYTASNYVSVYDNCSAAFTIVRDSASLYDFTIYNYATTGSGTLSYFWDFGDGNTSTLQNPMHTYAGTGPYYICLSIISSDSACSATHCDSVIAGRSTGAISVTVVTPASTTGISTATAVSTSLENYPNPFSGSTTVNYAVSQDATIELTVMDLLGNKVATLESGRKSAGAYTTVWNADGIAPGMYLLQMKTNNRVATKKIVISR